ncbi:MAG TPA: response regulator transcription factor [Thermoanaerobaculia bacterium]|nr:response regulator transcription factor [Thermoanaerobaculia bacterium]
MTAPLHLLIAARQPLFRECLAATLEQGGFTVEIAEVGDGAVRPALACLADRPADVLLVGLDLPEGAALLLRQVKSRFPDVAMLVVGSAQESEEILACLEAGARGYVLREQTLPELQAAIERVVRGEAVVTPEAAHRLFRRLGELGRESRRRRQLEFLDLTARELQILGLIAQGLSNQEVADRLCLSIHTVKNHVHNLLERLGLTTRAEAVEYARARGWLQRPERRDGLP